MRGLRRRRKSSEEGAGTQATAGGAPASVHETLRSPGSRSMPRRAPFSSLASGATSSGVRVHTDASAAQSAREVNAHAYSVGHDIAFDSGVSRRVRRTDGS